MPAERSLFKIGDDRAADACLVLGRADNRHVARPEEDIQGHPALRDGVQGSLGHVSSYNNDMHLFGPSLL